MLPDRTTDAPTDPATQPIGPAADAWTSYIALSFGTGLVLMLLGLGVLLTVHNGHRLAAFFVLFGLLSCGVGSLVRRASKNSSAS